MSKMSQAHMELSEQAYELGFESIKDAEAHGYHVTYTGNKVVLALDMNKAYKESHEYLMSEKERVIGGLESIQVKTKDELNVINEAIRFIEENVK